MVKKLKDEAVSTHELSLPEWKQLVQLVRNCLDAPLQVSKTPLLLREIAWSFLAGEAQWDFAKTLASESPHAVRLAFFVVSYLCKAGKLPTEFDEKISSVLMAIQNV